MREPEVPTADATTAGRQAGAAGSTIITDWERVHIPSTVVDLETFRDWTDEDDFPERANIWWLCGEVWADVSREQIFAHVFLKGEIFRVLANLIKPQALGLVLTDGLLLTNREGNFSGRPDGVYLSHASLDAETVRLVRGKRGGYTEVQGTPDMVLEVVSDSSVDKDTVVLLDAYWKAGIPEYWLVDARGDQLRFDIFRHGPMAYKHTPKKHGWMKSVVFGKSFRLSVVTDKAGRPDYTLEVR